MKGIYIISELRHAEGMRTKLLVVIPLLVTAACHKTPPIGDKIPPPVTRGPEQTTQTPQIAQRPADTKQPLQSAANTTPPNRPTTMPPEERTRINDILARWADALFDYDKSTIRADASQVLRADVDVVRESMSKYPQEKLSLEGHADQRGSDEYNLALGDRRAEAVRDFLITMGIPASQLTTISYGKGRPQCTEEDENCWQKNRRVHLSVASAAQPGGAGTRQ